MVERSPRMRDIGVRSNMSLKQEVTARNEVWVSPVLGDYHYKGFARVTVGVVR